MLLTIDVGNTHTVLGVYLGDTLIHMWRVQTDEAQTSDQAKVMLCGLFALEHIAPEDISGAALATVVPALNRLWTKVASELCDCEVLSINSATVEGILDISAYEGNVGADRIADGVAARALYGAPVIIVDMGTATNIEVIDREGCFRGGIIAPGVQGSADALFSKTALLPAVEIIDPHTAIGTNTVEAIQVGIVYGEVDRVDGLVRRVWKQLGYKTPVVATGGFGRAIAQLSSTVTAVNPELTLQGLHTIYHHYYD